MATLGDILGSILSDVAHARRIADQETLRIARFYRSEPLLKGMSVPRLRLPEIVIEMPVVLESHEPEVPEQPGDPAEIAAKATQGVIDSAAEHHIDLPDGFRPKLERAIRQRLLDDQRSLEFRSVDHRTTSYAEKALAIATRALSRLARSEGIDLGVDARRNIHDDLERAIEMTAVRTPARRGSIGVGVTTDVVKNRADSSNVTRIRVVVREEGLEWTESSGTGDGPIRLLTPE